MSPDFFYNLIAQASQGRRPIQVPPEEPFFEPNFLNLEYFFNLVFFIFDWLAALLAALLGVGGPSAPDLAFLKNIFWFFVLLLMGGIGFSSYKYWRIREEEKQKYWEAHWRALEKVEETEHNEAWQKVLDYMDSPNESDWKLAIIEADTMLNQMLESMQYVGDSIGDKLKGVERSDFHTIDEAWEVHRMRNKIAHEGASFALAKREAEHVIDLYKKVFEEFHHI